MRVTLALRAARAAAAAVLVACAANCARDYGQRSAAGWVPGTAEHSISVGSSTRTFLLHVPAIRRRNRLGIPIGYPLVILLHGSGADGETVRRQSRLDVLADSLRFAVAYPNGSSPLLGLRSDWNAGRCCGNAARSNVDDVAFVRGIIAEVSRRLAIDPRRVFVAGFSDGGRMAYRVACEMSSTVAAIGVVSGSLVDDHCFPTRPVPVIAFHGTSDPEVPYRDSAFTLSSAPVAAAAAALPPAIRFWSAMDRCSGLTLRREAPSITRATFTPCAGADVVLYTVEGGLHAWPGGEKDGSDGQQPTTELRATNVMVQFFLRHPRR
jgi:polyhydroxybutyrate depolymerase